MEKEIKDGLNFVLGAVSKVKEEFDVKKFMNN
jgi:hypothetical protein